jgi:hypothetical protein
MKVLKVLHRQLQMTPEVIHSHRWLLLLATAGLNQLSVSLSLQQKKTSLIWEKRLKVLQCRKRKNRKKLTLMR